MSRHGYWPQYDAHVYTDDAGPMSSGFLLVRTEDAHKVPGCLSNGYVEGGIPMDQIKWADDAPLRELEKLRAWKAEALQVMAGIQEIGRALGLPPGVEIHGEHALAAIEKLKAQKVQLTEMLRLVLVNSDPLPPSGVEVHLQAMKLLRE